MLQIYCGNGKGKTSAAIGSAIRAAGDGWKVLFVQFHKNNDSSEITVLESIPQMTCYFPKKKYVLFEEMTEKRKQELSDAYNQTIQHIIENQDSYDMIVLDELAMAYRTGTIDRKLLINWICEAREKKEIILTGRNPAEELIEMADYVSEIHMVKHPYYSQGITARKGIEF